MLEDFELSFERVSFFGDGGVFSQNIGKGLVLVDLIVEMELNLVLTFVDQEEPNSLGHSVSHVSDDKFEVGVDSDSELPNEKAFRRQLLILLVVGLSGNDVYSRLTGLTNLQSDMLDAIADHAAGAGTVRRLRDHGHPVVVLGPLLRPSAEIIGIPREHSAAFHWLKYRSINTKTCLRHFRQKVKKIAGGSSEPTRHC